MSLDSGTYISKNKILPGSYINFISTANTIYLQEGRGSHATQEDFYEFRKKYGRILIGPEDTPLGKNDTLFVVDGLEKQGTFVEITNLAFDDYNTKKENLAITGEIRASGATLGLGSKDFINGKLMVGERSKPDTTFFAKI